MRTYARWCSGALGAVMAVAVASGCGDSNSPTLQLAQNGGFETGDFTGWHVDNAGAGAFTVLSDSVVNLVDSILAPPESTYAAVVVQIGTGSHVLYQDIFLPVNSKIRFQATVYVESHAAFVDGGSLVHTGGSNQQFRVDIVDPAAPLRDVGAGVLLAVYRTMPGDTVETGYLHLTADLTPFAGQTVRIRFAEADNLEHLYAAVDAVSVTAK